MNSPAFSDPDDYFASTRMSFGDHLEDLRKHLIRAGIGFLVGFIFSFFIGHLVLKWIKDPVERQLREYRDAQVVKIEKMVATGTLTPELLQTNQPTKFLYYAIPKQAIAAAAQGKIDPNFRFEWKPSLPKDPNQAGESTAGTKEDPNRVLVTPDDCILIPVSIYDPLGVSLSLNSSLRESRGENQLATLAIQEPLMIYFKVCVVTGIVLGSPFIFWELWTFVAAGLYPHEKKYVYIFLPFSLGLFLGGVFICQFLVMPVAVMALLGFNDWIGLTPDLRLSEWLGFAIMMPLVFGVSFQTPLVILFLDSLGILDVKEIQGKRGIVWFSMSIFAAVITPSADPFSMMMLWIPLGLLFEIGILLCKLRNRRNDLEIDVPDRDELLGV